MKRRRFRLHLAVTLLLGMPAVGTAQTTVTLPDTSQTTTVSVNVIEQARVIVPTGITFNVTNIGASTPANAATVTVDRIILATATKQLKLSLQANSASFSPPVAGATTWAASDVTWSAPSWTNATGTAGTLSHGAYNAVATCNAGATSCSTTGLVFTLGANTAVQRSGAHTLVVTWKFESMGS
jgi:hypothetical protein